MVTLSILNNANQPQMKFKELHSSILYLLVVLSLASCRPVPEQIRNLTLQTEPSKTSGLTIQFLGNTNILLDDGETRILTDGFFSRPSAARLVLGKVKPNEKRIHACLESAGISKLDAVIPVHSHYDHALDAPSVAKITGAKLIGSSSTLMIGQGAGLAPEQMQLAPLDSAISIGKFNIRFIASRHWEYPSKKQCERLLDQGITEPLLAPASIYEFKEGISYTILIEHEGASIAIHGSAGFKENSLIDCDVDIVFLSIAGLEAMDQAYNDAYQEHTIEALHPEVIIPIHWDDFTVPLKRGLKTTSRLTNLILGANLSEAIGIVQANNPNRTMAFLPLWQKFPLDSLMRPKP